MAFYINLQGCSVVQGMCVQHTDLVRNQTYFLYQLWLVGWLVDYDMLRVNKNELRALRTLDKHSCHCFQPPLYILAVPSPKQLDPFACFPL